MVAELDEFATGKPLWRRVADFPLVALAIMAAVVAATLFAISQFALPHVRNAVTEEMIPVIIGLIIVPLVLLVYKLAVRHVGAVRRDDLAFDDYAKDFWRGVVLAAVLMSLLVGIVALLGGYRIVGWGGSTSFPMILFLAGVQAAFVEELIFRGILFRWLEEFGGSWFALLVTSALFGFAHISNDNATIFSSFAIAMEAGLLLGGAYMLMRNLWLAVGIHFGWNVVQGYIWDVSVSGFDVDGLVEAEATGHELISGGAFGLEASVVALVLATLVGVYFVWLAYQRGEIVKPWWVRRRLARRRMTAAHTD